MIEEELKQEVIEKYPCPCCGEEGKYSVHPWDDWEDFELCENCEGEGYFLVYQDEVIPNDIPGLKVREFM